MLHEDEKEDLVKTRNISKTETPLSLTAGRESAHAGSDNNEVQHRIAARAYALYQERGYRQGCDLQDWVDAEREILSRQPAV